MWVIQEVINFSKYLGSIFLARKATVYSTCYNSSLLVDSLIYAFENSD